MKRCPKCNIVATDDTHAFCRADGVLLVDSDSFGESETIDLQLVAPAASTSEEDESLNGPVGSTGLMNSLIGKSSLGNLIEKYKRPTVVWVTASVIALTLAVSTYFFVSRKGNATINSVAVLPFLNVNADQQLDYLSDGMTETLIYNLSRLPKLNVKALSSVSRYKGKDVTPRTVGEDLNVQAILNGRIVQRGDVLTLSLELADARTENVIWNEQYSRNHTELVSLQSEIARDVAGKLRVKLAGADEQILSKKYTTDSEAYQLYLKGRFCWNKRTAIDLERAIDRFDQAILLDPNYALAYAGLADSYVLLPFYRDAPVREGMRQAREAATKALSLDGNLDEAHAALGLANTCESSFIAAEREFKIAIELNPDYATAHTWYGVMLFYLGRHGEASIELQRAIEIDPLSLIANVTYGEGLFYARRYDEAIAQLKKTIELDDKFERAHSILSNVYQATGSYNKAVEEYARYQDLMGERQTATLVRDSFAKGGWHGFLRAMTGGQRPAGLSRHNLVIFLAALGEKDKAFSELSKSYEVFGRLKIDPLLDPLRDDPRFEEILRRAEFLWSGRV
ncbi:MAG TPA: tetratricopeptide repeat protein [Blastocatellia bacterium]|nr:tetratricopeptide repeat protein [Blastocatellia bacterium]